jgi:hypothetical protein
MGKLISALVAIKEIIGFVKEAIKLIEKIIARNKYKRQKDAQEDIESAKKAGDAGKLGDAIRRL